MKTLATSHFEEQILSGKTYVLAAHWKTELDFYLDELNFLNTLINKYFVFLIRDYHLVEVQKITAALTNTMKKQAAIVDKINAYKSALKALISKVPMSIESKQIHQLSEDHEHIENEFSEFAKDFRMLKREIFKITEKVLETEKVKKLISAF